MVSHSRTNSTYQNNYLRRICNNFVKYFKNVDGKETKNPGHFLLTKAGHILIERKGLEKHRFNFFKDYYNSILEMRWHWAILLFFFSHAVTFVSFTVIWWLNSFLHGDFDSNNSYLEPCIPGLNTFADFFLFSVETQTTVGFGTVYPRFDCIAIIPTLFFQVSIGFILEGISLGFVFVKMVRPKNRSSTIQFSRKACICYENKHKVLQIQVADFRHTHLIDAKVSGMLVTKYKTHEGFLHPLYQIKMDFEINGAGNRLFLMWPLVLTHYIADDSPFFSCDRDPFDKNIEIVVWINGVIESTGEMCQVKTSYIADEIVWGRRFVQENQFDYKNGRLNVDFSRFGKLAPCPMLVPDNSSFDEVSLSSVASETEKKRQNTGDGLTVAGIH
ncbi:ATP-sensitive inward rectifier potassium channel 10-like [Argonauta hians]